MLTVPAKRVRTSNLSLPAARIRPSIYIRVYLNVLVYKVLTSNMENKILTTNKNNSGVALKNVLELSKRSLKWHNCQLLVYNTFDI